MRVTVDGPATYQGVRVDHPDIIAGIENLARQGRTNEDICRIIGMPVEVVEKYARPIRAAS